MKVYIKQYGANTRTYHTQKDCQYLGENPVRKDKAMLNDKWSECQICSGEFDGFMAEVIKNRVQE